MKLHFLQLCTSRALLALFVIVSFGNTLIQAQTPDADEDENGVDDDVVMLNPFEVITDDDVGYLATETMAGSRLKTSLKDIGASVTVITEQLLEDISANDNETLLANMTNAEIGGPLGNYSSGPQIVGTDFGPRENESFQNPNGNNRIRGLSSADQTRNFFISDIPWDIYNTGQIEFTRGPNAILAGLGSPAGLINTTSDRAVVGSTVGKVVVKYDKYGSVRTTLNYNRDIIEGQLAARIALLNDEQNFQQEPAFENDQRYFGSLTYQPQVLNQGDTFFQVTVNVEKGEIQSNRPRNVTPQDNVTPFFDSSEWGLNRETYSHLDDFGALPPQVGSILGNDPHYYINSAGNPSGVNGGSMFVMLNLPNGIGTLNAAGDVQGLNQDPPIATSVRIDGVNRPLVAILAKNAIASGIGAEYSGYYNISTLSDPGIFNFYTQLLDGPNKGEWRDWTTYNVDLSHTFKQGKFGYNVAIFNEELDQGRFAAMGWGNRIFIDINEHTPTGAANPNLGRLYVNEKLQQTGQNDDRIHRDAARAQVFFKHDFTENSDSFLMRVLGRHTVTAVASEEIFQRKSWGTKSHSLDPAFNALFTNNNPVAGNATTPYFKHYISGDVSGVSSPSQIHATNLTSAVFFNNSTIPVTYFSPVWIADESVDPGAEWLLPEGSSGEGNFEAANPANYEGWVTRDVRVYSPTANPNVMVEGTNMTVNEYLAVNPTAFQSQIRSRMAVWQGWWFNDSISTLVGYRKDTATDYRYTQSSASSGRSDGGGNIDPSVLNFSHQEIDSNNETVINSISGDAWNWSIGIHLNELLGERDFLPLAVSVYYNEGETFKPAPGRFNLDGKPIPSPVGTTEEYSVRFGLKNSDKLSLRIIKYETLVTNQTLTSNLQSWAFSHVFGTYGFLSPAVFYESVMRHRAGYTEAGGIQGWRAPINIDDLEIEQTRKDELNAGVDAWTQFAAGLREQFPEFMAAFGGTAPPDADDEFFPLYGLWLDRIPYAFTEDALSKGYEIELVYNPTSNWRIMLNASKTQAIRTNVPGDYNGRLLDYIDDTLWNTDAGELPMYGWYEGSMRESNYAAFHNSYQQAKALNGQLAGEIREWKYTLITNYNFAEGALEGLGVGGSLRWEDDSIIGYRPTTVTSDEGVVSDFIDVNKPVYAPSETTVGLWASYKFTLGENIDWKVQLNVNNAFGNNEVIPISSQPDGSGAVYRIKEGMSWSLTNTISF